MKIAYPGESDEYRLARNRLLEQELALRRMMEAVAEARTRAAAGWHPCREDYLFDAAHARRSCHEDAPLGALRPGRDTLLLYSFMFPRHPEDERPKADARRDREAAARREPVPVVHRAPRPARRRGSRTSRRS